MEGALLEYQRPIIDSANESVTPRGNNAVDEVYNKRKRRRLNPPCDVLSHGNVDDDNTAEPDTESQQELRDSLAIGYEYDQSSVDDNGVVDPSNSSPKILEGDDLDIFNKAMDKIRSAIKEKFTSSDKKKPTVPQSNTALEKFTISHKKKPTSQPQSVLKIVSQSNTSFRNYQDLSGNSVELERMFFDEAHGLLKEARQMAWKLRFIASCMRILRGAVPLARSGDGREHSEWRWTRASRIVNSIVVGLWDHWGPKACIIYEVLAGKVFHTLWYNC